MGFYGNGETSDGVHRATYSLRHANRTVAGVQDRVSDWLGSVLSALEPSVCVWDDLVVQVTSLLLAPVHIAPLTGVGYRCSPEPHSRAQPTDPGAAAGWATGATEGCAAAAKPSGDTVGLYCCHPLLEEPRRITGGAG